MNHSTASLEFLRLRRALRRAGDLRFTVLDGQGDVSGHFVTDRLDRHDVDFLPQRT